MTESIVDYIKKSFDLKNKGYYKPAIEMLYKALAIDGDNLEIFAQLAHLYKLLENYDRALYYIEKVLEIDDKHLDCLALLLEIKLLHKDTKAALGVSEKIYNIQPDSHNLAKKVELLNELKDFDKIKKIESYDENLLNDEVYFGLASAYYANSDSIKATELLKKGYEKNNKNPKLILLLAKIDYDNGDFEDAKKLFKRLEDFAPTPEVMNYIGMIKLGEQLFVEAIDYFMIAQKADQKMRSILTI